MSVTVMALDLGASTGVAVGAVGETPRLATWDIRGPTREARGTNLTRRLTRALKDNKPDALFVEAAPNLTAMVAKGTTIDTLMALYGYDMVVGMVALDFELRCERVDVIKARRSFLGVQRRKRRGDTRRSKDFVRARCAQLGWQAENDNESDAACIWHYGCAHASPNEWMRAVQEHSAKISTT